MGRLSLEVLPDTRTPCAKQTCFTSETAVPLVISVLLPLGSNSGEGPEQA